MPSALSDGLSVTNAQRVRDLDDDYPYDYIITLGYYDSFSYERPALSDTGDMYVFPDGPHDYADFEAAVDAIRDALHAGKHVLVHCQAGCSRSPSACIAALAVEDGDTYEDAYWRVKHAHDPTNPTDDLEASARRYISDHQSSVSPSQ